jgi:hypothetical protein
MKNYDPLNWYWRVADSATQVYSSKARDFVPVEDADYAAWGEDGTTPTAIDTDYNVGGVLATYTELRPIPQSVLDGYQDAMAQRLSQEPDIALWADVYMTITGGSRADAMARIKSKL